MRIGLMGGTFDPVHYGHLKPAAEVKARLELDKLWLLPNPIPPHKAKATASSEQRLAMLKLACDEFPDMDICDIELKRNAPSYSVATLEALQQAFPGAEFQFIMGTDSLLSLPSWHQWQRLFSLCNLVVCQRPDWHLPKDAEIQTELAQRGCSVTQALAARDKGQHQSGKIISLPVEPQPFSSTAIRRAIAVGDINACRAAMPKAVLEYIIANRLYLGG
ncbi:nicotinate-nucleotide adenylyltransferase [Shewanella algae]|uniref:nicotinate-nucleotide adenylyltransferase n=1 Tax=Shewanella algae TaxID=38313 RepID=UPI001AAC7733|nr:nicotinate-nucleotide adenylyltransferase [Shewanella algae]MBO2557877.1 nicotinate-nucleotide adenylyltransferase [Shewanella algae]MBO2574813.1 nicotinate-nucleotide adenylyltransferase [Shewanella algae]